MKPFSLGKKRTAAGLQRGSVFEIETDSGLVYLQFLSHDALGMSICRALPGVYERAPELGELVRRSELWLPWEPLQSRHQELRHCGIYAVPENDVAIRYRSFARAWTQAFETQWYIVDPMTGDYAPAAVDEIMDLSPYEAIGFSEIADRIRRQWTPRDGVAEMHAIWKQKSSEAPTSTSDERSSQHSSSSRASMRIHHYMYARSVDVAQRVAEAAASAIPAKSVEVQEGPMAGEWGIHVFTEGRDVDVDAERLQELAARAGVEYDGHELGPLDAD
ncbi:hypothetical protein [Euzebya sp.]|uniref:hypothetical protein n=1 Tax=Euzebya sp. TaxID=1971409 RepID=UPI003517F1F2